METQTSASLVRQAVVFFDAGRLAEAAHCLEDAALQEPDSLEIFSRLGSVYYALNNFARAGDCFAQCLKLAPSCAEAYYHLGNVCNQMRHFEKARWLYFKAAELQPANYKIWNNLGSCLRELDELDAAFEAFDRALALNPTDASTHCNRAVALLTVGRWTEGWQEYEWRRQLLGLRRYPHPDWLGEPLAGKTLFLHAEQGFGDMIQFVRFARQIRSRGSHVILECFAPLRRLFELSDCADQYITYKEQEPPAFDCYQPLMSLAGVLNAPAPTSVASGPYLKAPATPALPIRPGTKLKVGLVWTCNLQNAFGLPRLLRLGQLAEWFTQPDITFYSLHPTLSDVEYQQMAGLPALVDLAPLIHDFADTAALVSHLDLVISVDTAVAHLAGALGKPVWTLLPFPADWRWLRQTDRSLWYPTMRLFRQPAQDDWAPVIEQVRGELAHLRNTL